MAVINKRKGKKAADAGPPCPPEVRYLFTMWEELHAARGCGMTPNPISWADIAAFSALCDEQLEPWEARTIRKVDATFLSTVLTEGVGGAA